MARLATNATLKKIGITLIVAGMFLGGIAIWAAIDVTTNEGWIGALGWWSGCMVVMGFFVFGAGAGW